MNTIQDLIHLHTHCFPEEAYLTRLHTLNTQDTPDQLTEKEALFAQKYTHHLSQYKKYFLPNLTEQCVKYTLLINYHLVYNEELSLIEIQNIHQITKEVGVVPITLPLYLAHTDLIHSIRAYRAVFPNSITTQDTLIESEQLLTQPVDTTPIPTLPLPWTTWCEDMYGYTPLPLLDLVSFGKNILSDQKRQPSDTNTHTQTPEHTVIIPSEDVLKTAHTIYQALTTLYSISVENLSIEPLTDQLKRTIPSAAAYTFGRFGGQVRRVAYINHLRSWKLSDLVLVVAHEILGHLYHFQLVDHASPLIARIPAYYRYPVTEGVALLVEQLVKQGADTLSHELKKSLGLAIDSVVISRQIKATADTLILRRVIRALFETYIYQELQTPEEAFVSLKQAGFDIDTDIKEDVRSFLPTPGYGATYIHGYIALMKTNIKLDRSRWEKLGTKGFDLESLSLH
jgi:hypothetical protein